MEVIGQDRDAFTQRLQRENHTLKRALTDPSIFSGIGNAYSDEILHHAQLSPFKQTKSLDEQELQSLYDAVQQVLQNWTDQLRQEVGGGFSPIKSPHSKRAWQCTASMVSPARYAAPRCNASSTHRTRPIIVQGAKPVENYSQTGRYPGCSRRIGPKRWTSWKILIERNGAYLHIASRIRNLGCKDCSDIR